MPRLLLLSNSTTPGEPYLGWPREAIADFLATAPPGTRTSGARRVAFVPYAGVRFSWDDYAARVREALAPLGHEVLPVHHAADPVAELERCDAVAVGGGNTFHLLLHLARTGLLAALRARVAAGLPYVGWSAGSVVACPTIRTTNDMPIVEPPSLAAIGLVPFQINAHYTEAVLPNHGGETRQERLAEFLVANPETAVLCLREGSGLRVEGTAARLLGAHPCVVLRHGADPETRPVDATLDDLLLINHATTPP
jgi:dipeptidase E